MRSFFVILLMVFCSVSCIRSIDLDIPDDNERILVVDGQLTSLNINNYVRLTWARSPKSMETLPVQGASVIITSDNGEIDTLVKQFPEIIKYEDTTFQGYYYARKLVCLPGKTYKLRISVQGMVYTAVSFMPPVTSIDSVKCYPGYVRKRLTGYFPLIYFKEPQYEKNYYMTQICSGGPDRFLKRVPCRFSDRIWNVAILDDEHLPPYVNGLNINVGVTPSSYFKGWLLAGYDYRAFLYSLTPESYRYYEALIKSITSDGGVYSPAPANAPTNIKSTHKVIGFFNASAVSDYRFVPVK